MNMEKKNSKNISRRDFLKDSGLAAAAVGSVAALGACAPKKAADLVTTGSKPDSILDTGKMATRQTPDGETVSLLGYGCMRFQMHKDEKGNDVLDQDNVNSLIDYALAHGVTYFDTSPAYLRGQSETFLGNALSRHDRKSYHIATKLSNFGDQSREASMMMYHKSFEYLQTDYIDFYLLHSIGRGGVAAFNQRYVDNGMMPFLMKEREAGRIKRLGFSFHGNQEEFDKLLAMTDEYHYDFVQIQCNYYDWKHADGVRNVNAEYLYEQLDKRNLPIVVMEPLQGSRLANPADNIVRQLKERDPEASVASWAFRYVGSHPRILTILSGMAYMEHLKDNLKTFMDFKPLTEEEQTFLDTNIADEIANYPLIDCNDCKYCMPCPYGLDIPGIFKYYNQSINEGKFAQSKEQENYKKLRRAFLVGYDRTIPSLRQASHCVGCHQCVPHCPQSIDIPRQLRKIDQYVERLKRDLM
jgi:predicted aldo/keto reductase-like oxidoreductase